MESHKVFAKLLLLFESQLLREKYMHVVFARDLLEIAVADAVLFVGVHP